MKISRRKWLGTSFLFGSGLASFGYGRFIEKQWLRVNRFTVRLDEQHAGLSGLKIALMADFHHDDFGDQSLVRRAVEAVNNEKVDLVYLLGDYITRDASAIVPLCEELCDLRSRLGTFGVMGNHDRNHGNALMHSTLRESGVRMLIDDAVEFDDFCIAGIDSYRGKQTKLTETLNRLPAAKPILVGWHEPDSFDLQTDPRVALQVSGHTHGGQVCAPLLGPIVLPKYGRKYPYGLYRRDKTAMFVTRGIGTLSFPIRFLCSPEVAILNLEVATSQV